MALYEYQCEACGHRVEVIQRWSDPPLDKCPKCDGPMHKLVSAPAFQFKGTGWYVTDYAKKDQGGQGGSAKSSGDSKADAKSGSESGDKSEKSDKSEKAEKTDKSEKSDKPADSSKPTASGDSSSSSTTPAKSS